LLNVLGDYFISNEKSGHVLQGGRMLVLLNNATHTRPVQIQIRQTQNLPVTSSD